MTPKYNHGDAVYDSLRLLRQDLLDVLVGEEDVDDMVPPMLQRCVFEIDVRRQEQLGIPRKALARGEVRDLIALVSYQSHVRPRD